MAIKITGSAQKYRVGRVSGNTGIFFLPNVGRTRGPTPLLSFMCNEICLHYTTSETKIKVFPLIYHMRYPEGWCCGFNEESFASGKWGSTGQVSKILWKRGSYYLTDPPLFHSFSYHRKKCGKKWRTHRWCQLSISNCGVSSQRDGRLQNIKDWYTCKSKNSIFFKFV